MRILRNQLNVSSALECRSSNLRRLRSKKRPRMTMTMMASSTVRIVLFR